MVKKRFNNYSSKKNIFLILGIIVGIVFVFVLANYVFPKNNISYSPEDDDKGGGEGEIPSVPACPVGEEVGNEETGVSVYACQDLDDAKEGCDKVVDSYSCSNGETCCLNKKPNGCPEEYFKCQASKSYAAICCRDGDTCGSTDIGGGGNYCKANECPDGQVLCGGVYGNAGICCNELASGESPCGTQGIKRIPYCKTDTGCKEGSPGYCAPGLCCSENENCDTSNGVKLCQPKNDDSCNEGETYCAGSGDASGRKRCCPAGTMCFRSENGWPSCA